MSGSSQGILKRALAVAFHQSGVPGRSRRTDMMADFLLPTKRKDKLLPWIQPAEVGSGWGVILRIEI